MKTRNIVLIIIAIIIIIILLLFVRYISTSTKPVTNIDNNSTNSLYWTANIINITNQNIKPYSSEKTNKTLDIPLKTYHPAINIKKDSKVTNVNFDSSKPLIISNGNKSSADQINNKRSASSSSVSSQASSSSSSLMTDNTSQSNQVEITNAFIEFNKSGKKTVWISRSLSNSTSDISSSNGIVGDSGDVIYQKVK